MLLESLSGTHLHTTMHIDDTNRVVGQKLSYTHMYVNCKTPRSTKLDDMIKLILDADNIPLVDYILTSLEWLRCNRKCQGGPPRFSPISAAKSPKLHYIAPPDFRPQSQLHTNHHGFGCIQTSQVCCWYSYTSTISQTGRCPAKGTHLSFEIIANTTSCSSYVCAITEPGPRPLAGTQISL